MEKTNGEDKQAMKLFDWTNSFFLVTASYDACYPKWRRDGLAGSEVHMASSGGLKRVSRWFPRPLRAVEDDEDSSERNGLLMSHLDQVVPVADADEDVKAIALHVEPKTVELKVSMHCHGCARKVEKQVSKLQGVVSFKVELDSKKVTVVGNVSPSEVLESVCKVMKRAEILPAPY